MKIDGKHTRTIVVSPDRPDVITVIDQRFLPHKFILEDLRSVNDVIAAIKDMHIRCAGLIGVTAAHGVYLASYLASKEFGDDVTKFLEAVTAAAQSYRKTRPTAVNLECGVNRVLCAIRGAIQNIPEMVAAAKKAADAMAEEDVSFCQLIGQHGLALIEKIAKTKKPGDAVNILTHCNAGWLAFVDYGTATAPIYAAHDKGIKVHVWVDETRPRNQGAKLTAWELLQHGVPHTVIADNVGGHLMVHGLVDFVITGADRVTSTGDAANKIGTYLKALAAKDNNIPFYVAFPSTTFDWSLQSGMAIPIEQRDSEEVRFVNGLSSQGDLVDVLVTPHGSPVANYGFDVTPARLITGLITERGICAANADAILGLYPNKGN